MMIKLGLLKTFVISFGIFVSDYHAHGASSRISAGRVINGIRSKKAAWPWHVIISKATNGDNFAYDVYATTNFLGGGSLINDRWILTAAHVFSNHPNQSDWEQCYFLTLGMHKRPNGLIDKISSSVQMFRSHKIFIHLNFSFPDYDIALVKIGQKYAIQSYSRQFISSGPENVALVNFTKYIQPVRLPCTKTNCLTKRLKIIGKLIGEDTEEKQCRREKEILYRRNHPSPVVLTGFGDFEPRAYIHNEETSLSKYLLQASLRIKDQTYCKNFNNNRISWGNRTKVNFTERMFCGTAIGRENLLADACQGDSGGAVVRKMVFNDGPNCWVQIGIVSWGWGCGQFVGENPVPGFYTNVSKFTSWIAATMNENETRLE